MSDIPTLHIDQGGQRFVAAPKVAGRGRLAIAAVAALLIEAGVIGLAMWRHDVAPPPQVVEIPVEMVTEPPPPPPPSPPSPAPQPQEMLKPATDAPRAGQSDHEDEHVADKEKPAAAPPPPAPTPSSDPSPPAEAAAPDLLRKAEPDAPEPQKTETPKPAAPQKPAVLAALPKTFEDVPNVDFGGAAVRSPVTGGAAQSNYLTQLYGLIMPRLHVPALAKAYGHRLTGALVFQVDARGRLMQRVVVEGSGSMELDEAAMEAVAQASKAFPPPPKGEPAGIRFVYHSTD